MKTPLYKSEWQRRNKEAVARMNRDLYMRKKGLRSAQNAAWKLANKEKVRGYASKRWHKDILASRIKKRDCRAALKARKFRERFVWRLYNDPCFRFDIPKSRRRLTPEQARENRIKGHRNWVAKNRERIRTYDKMRRTSNPQSRLKHLLNAKVRKELKRQNAIKRASLAGLLGIPVDGFVAHIASLFKPGMTWENRGVRGWHLDHIRPCSSFDLTDPEQQKQCYHYTNFQPLWWLDNIIKSDKWEPNKLLCEL